MTKQSWTAGPWRRNIPPATKYTTVWSGRNKHVAHIATTGLAPEEAEANITLIALAPEMAEALRDLFAEVSAMEKRVGWTGYGARDRVRAIISRLESGQ